MNVIRLQTTLILFLICPLILLSQPAVWSPAGAANIATAGAQAGLNSSFWSLFGNPAGMSGLEAITIGSHVEQRFSIREMSAAQIGIVAPIGDKQAAGLRISWFGLGTFGEGRYAISYSISPLEHLRIGTSLSFYQTVIPSQGSGRSVFIDLGIQYDLSDQLTLGMFAVNANRAVVQNLGDSSPLPSLIQAGLRFKASEEVTLVADIGQEVNAPLTLRAGIHYHPADRLLIRAGVRTGPSAVSAGIGLKFESFLLDMTAEYIPILGLSPHVGFTYQIAENEA